MPAARADAGEPPGPPPAGWRARPAARPVGLLLLVLLLALRLLDPPPLQALRLRALDVYQALRPRVPDERVRPVLIVDIDEASLAAVGQWPWPRSVIAELVDRIAARGPAVIGFDILFAEPDGSSPARLIERYPGIDAAARRSLEALPDDDARLAGSLRATRAVLGMGANFHSTPAGRRSFRYPAVRMKGADVTSALPAFGEVIRSIDAIDAAAAGHASLTEIPEPDGIVRRLPGAIRVGDAVIPGLAIEMLRVGLGEPAFTLEGDERGVVAVAAGDYRAPAEPDGRIWVPHTRHVPGRFVPAAAVLAGDDGADFRGRIVLIGTTGLGITDLYTTPVEPKMYGIEIQAELLEAIVAGAALRRPGWSAWAELAAAATGGILIIIVTPALSLRRVGAALAGLLGALAGGGWVAYAAAGLLLDPSYPAAATATVFTAMLGLHLARVERDRRRLEADLRAQREQALRLEGEMAAARDIQMGMLPKATPSFPRRGCEVRAFIEPAREVGGDLYDFFFLDAGRLFFVIGDVSGKGVPAALFMSLTQALCRSSALRIGAGAGAILADVNDALGRENEAMMFVTAFAGILDFETGWVDYCSAGHEAAWVVRRAAPPRRLAGGGGPPLGTVVGFPFEAGRDRLEEGECLVLLTDGVVEARNPAGDLYGASRVSALLSDLEEVSAEAVVRGVRADVQRHVAGGEPADDLTILAIRRSGA